MAGRHFAVGDQVRVRWNDALYDAAAIPVHAASKVDVVHDADGTAGVFLRLCITHGGKTCLVDGCSTEVHARGLCSKHGW